MPPFPQYHPVWLPLRNRPAEFHRGQGWEMNQVPVKIKKKYYHLVWPKDGKNGSKWGRMKDILTGKGPDIHCTVSANKMDYMEHRPRKGRWSLHPDLDPDSHDCTIPSWSKSIDNKRERSGTKYDFYTRRFVKPYAGMWTDVKWQEKPWESEKHPVAFRDMNGLWWQDPYYAPPRMFGT